MRWLPSTKPSLVQDCRAGAISSFCFVFPQLSEKAAVQIFALLWDAANQPARGSSLQRLKLCATCAKEPSCLCVGMWDRDTGTGAAVYATLPTYNATTHTPTPKRERDSVLGREKKKAGEPTEACWFPTRCAGAPWIVRGCLDPRSGELPNIEH